MDLDTKQRKYNRLYYHLVRKHKKNTNDNTTLKIVKIAVVIIEVGNFIVEL